MVFAYSEWSSGGLCRAGGVCGGVCLRRSLLTDGGTDTTQHPRRAGGGVGGVCLRRSLQTDGGTDTTQHPRRAANGHNAILITFV